MTSSDSCSSCSAPKGALRAEHHDICDYPIVEESLQRGVLSLLTTTLKGHASSLCDYPINIGYPSDHEECACESAGESCPWHDEGLLWKQRFENSISFAWKKFCSNFIFYEIPPIPFQSFEPKYGDLHEDNIISFFKTMEKDCMAYDADVPHKSDPAVCQCCLDAFERIPRKLVFIAKSLIWNFNYQDLLGKPYRESTMEDFALLFPSKEVLKFLLYPRVHFAILANEDNPQILNKLNLIPDAEDQYRPYKQLKDELHKQENADFRRRREMLRSLFPPGTNFLGVRSSLFPGLPPLPLPTEEERPDYLRPSASDDEPPPFLHAQGGRVEPGVYNVHLKGKDLRPGQSVDIKMKANVEYVRTSGQIPYQRLEISFNTPGSPSSGGSILPARYPDIRVSANLNADMHTPSSASFRANFQGCYIKTTTRGENLDVLLSGTPLEPEPDYLVGQAGVDIGGGLLSPMKSANIILVDQDVEKDVGIGSSMDLGHLDTPWTYMTMMERPVKLYSGAWDTSQDPGTLLAKFMISDLLKKYETTYNPFLFLQYSSAHFRVQFTASQYQLGAVAMSVVPNANGAFNAEDLTFPELFNLRGVSSHLTTGMSLETEVPWWQQQNAIVHPKKMSPGVDPIFNDHQVVIWSQTKLRTGTGTPNIVPFVVWGWFTNFRVSVRQPRDEVVEVLYAQGSASSKTENVYNVNYNGSSQNTSIGGGGGSSASQTTDVKADVSVPEFDAPEFEHQGVGIVPSQNNNLLKGFCPRKVDQFSLDFAHLSHIPGRFDLGEEFSFEFLAGRHAFRSLFQIDSAQAAGALVWSDTFTYQSPKYCEPFFAILNEFGYVRADVVYRFQFIPSFLHQFRYMIGVVYGDNVVAAEDTTFQTGMLGESNTHEITIPYRAVNPWCRSHDLVGLVQGDGTVKITSDFDDIVFSKISLYVVNPLTGPDGVPKAIDVIVTMRLENLQVAVPSRCMYLQPPLYENIALSETTHWQYATAFQPSADWPSPAPKTVIDTTTPLNVTVTNELQVSSEPPLHVFGQIGVQGPVEVETTSPLEVQGRVTVDTSTPLDVKPLLPVTVNGVVVVDTTNPLDVKGQVTVDTTNPLDVKGVVTVDTTNPLNVMGEVVVNSVNPLEVTGTVDVSNSVRVLVDNDITVSDVGSPVMVFNTEETSLFVKEVPDVLHAQGLVDESAIPTGTPEVAQEATAVPKQDLVTSLAVGPATVITPNQWFNDRTPTMGALLKRSVVFADIGIIYDMSKQRASSQPVLIVPVSPMRFPNQTAMNNIGRQFTMWCGSLNYTWRLEALGDFSDLSSISFILVFRPGEIIAEPSAQFYVVEGPGDPGINALQLVPDSTSGGIVLGSGTLNNAVTVNVPHYTEYSFFTTSPYVPDSRFPPLIPGQATTGEHNGALELIVSGRGNDTLRLRVTIFASAGDDFRFMLYRGTRTWKKEDSIARVLTPVRQHPKYRTYCVPTKPTTKVERIEAQRGPMASLMSLPPLEDEDDEMPEFLVAQGGIDEEEVGHLDSQGMLDHWFESAPAHVGMDINLSHLLIAMSVGGGMVYGAKKLANSLESSSTSLSDQISRTTSACQEALGSISQRVSQAAKQKLQFTDGMFTPAFVVGRIVDLVGVVKHQTTYSVIQFLVNAFCGVVEKSNISVEVFITSIAKIVRLQCQDGNADEEPLEDGGEVAQRLHNPCEDGEVQEDEDVELCSEAGVAPEVGLTYHLTTQLLGVKPKPSRFLSYFKGTTDVFRNVHFLNLGVSSLCSIVERTCTIIQKVYDFLYNDDPQVRSIKYLRKDPTKLYRILALAARVTDDKVMSQLIHDSEMRRQVQILHAFFDTLEIDDDRDNQEVKQILLMKRKLYARNVMVQTTKEPEEVRPDPFAVYFVGEPGKGKSAVAARIGREVLDRCGERRPPSKEYCYWVPPAEDYMSGLTDMTIPICGFDDFNIINRSEATDVPTFLNMKTNNPFYPNFADLSRKGLQWSPKLVLLCSNVAAPSFVGVQKPDALLRRRDVVLKVSVKPEYADIPITQIPDDVKLNFRHLLFKEVDKFHPENVTNDPRYNITRDVSETVKYLCELYTKHRKNQAKLIDAILYGSPLVAEGEKDHVEALDALLRSNRAALPELDWSLVRIPTPNDAGEEEEEVFVEKFPEFLCGDLNLNELPSIPRITYVNIANVLAAVMRSSQLSWDKLEQVLNRAGYKVNEAGLFAFIGRYIYEQHRDWMYDQYEAGGIGFFQNPDLVSVLPLEIRTNLDLMLPLTYPGLISEVMSYGVRYMLLNDLRYQVQTRLGKWTKVVTAFKNLKAWGCGFMEWMKKNFMDIIETALGVWVLLFVLKKVVNIYRQILAPLELTAEAGSHGSGDARTRYSARKMHVPSSAKAQGAMTVASTMVNHYQMILRSGGMRLHGLAVGAHDILTVGHFSEYLSKSDTLTIERTGATASYLVEELEVVFSKPGIDLMIIRLPEHAPFFRVNKHLIPKKTLEHLGSGRCVFPFFEDGLPVYYDTEYHLRTKPIPVKESNAYPDGKLLEYFNYRIPSRGGLCGVPLVCEHNTNGRIIGVHVAGNGYWAAAQPICKELIDSMVSQFKPRILFKQGEILGVENTFDPESIFPLTFKAFQPIAVVEKVRCPEKSNIIPSDVHGVFQAPTSGPAVLSTKDPRFEGDTTPLRRGMEKFATGFPSFPTRFLHRVVEHYTDRYRAIPSVRNVRKMLTINEAVSPPPLECYERINVASSEGYPYILRRPKGASGARWLFELNSEGEYYLKDEEVRRHVIRLCADARQGIYHPSVFTATLKDERRPLSKINKARLFTAGNKAFTLFHRQHLLDFIAALSYHRHKLGHGVGTNPHSDEWAHWYGWLLETGTNWIAGDHSQFDGKIAPPVMYALFEVAYDWYRYHGATPGHHACYKALAQDHVHSKILVHNTVYELQQGEPSGSPSTAAFNTEYNRWLIALAWLELTVDKPEYHSLAAFEKHTRVLTYGDDLVISVTNQVGDFFNMLTLEGFFSSYGMTFTDPAKQQISSRKFMDPSEVTFLKRYFRPDEVTGIVYAPMEITSLHEIPNWIRDERVLSNAEATQAVVTSSLQEFVHYGKEAFTQAKEALNHALEQACIEPLVLSFHDLHEQFWPRRSDR